MKSLVSRFAIAFGLLGPLALGACSTAQLQATQTDISTGIKAACTDVMAVAAAVPTVPQAAYAVAACGTAETVATLVQNSDTIQWLGGLQAQLAAAKTATPVVPAS